MAIRFRPRKTVDLEHGDRALVERMLAGEQKAFDDFFEGHYRGLYRFALARLERDDELARDVAQTTIVQAVRHLASYRGEASLKSWVYSICRNEIAASYRRRQRRPVEVELATDDPELEATLDSLPSALEGPDALLGRKEVASLVHSILDRLPSRYGDALEWKYLHGISVNEIARRLEVGPKAAESLLTRARRAFRDAFQAVEASGALS